MSPGYRDVDGAADPAELLQAMDATSRWPATRRLRAWERARLSLRPGQRLLDVGCGLGDAALALAHDLGPDGEVVGVDASATMVDAAQARAGQARCRTRFVVGDALRLLEPDASFDAARAERTLQWVADPAAAVAELARVVRPGGRVSLVDSDWSTLVLDIGDDDLARRVRAAFQVERRRPSNVGGRLDALSTAAGLEVVATAQATHAWDGWDPDLDPVPAGCSSMVELADDLVERGALDAADAAAFVARVHDAARAGRCAMGLTMTAVVARHR